MKGFAIFWALALASASAGWLEALAAHQAAVDDAQVALVQLGQKRVIDADVRHVLSQSLADARGPDVESRVADAVRRLGDAEVFLESEYVRQGVALDVFFGFLSEPEQDAWLDSLAQGSGLQKCERCLDPNGGPLASVLSASADSGVVVSRDGLHRQSLPFVPFGVPVLGAVYRFGEVLGVVLV